MKEKEAAYYYRIFILVFLVMPCVLSAQNIDVDSPGEIHKKRQEVFSRIKEVEDPFTDSLWYQGRIYEFELRSQIGTPYFLNLMTMSGNITYEGKLHEDLILSYNLIMDELILWIKGKNADLLQLVLNKYFVQKFTLEHHGNDFNFRLHTEMEPIHDQLEEGFYEVVYDNELSMFIKHKKKLLFDPNKVDHYYYGYEKDVYLIKDGKIRHIDKRKDYLSAFQLNRKSLRRYMRRENINFEESGTQILSALCEYTKSLLDQQVTGID